MLCHKAEMLPIECIVRGYLTGLGLEGVQGLGDHARHRRCPRACRSRPSSPSRCSRPSTKAEVGDHDENISFEAAVDLVGAEVAEAGPGRLPRALPAGRRVGGRAGDPDRRHQVRAGLGRRRADRLRRGAHPGLVPVLAGRPVDAGLDPAVLRQAAGPGLPRRPWTGTRPRRPPPLPDEVVAGRLAALRRGLRAHQRPDLRRLARRRWLSADRSRSAAARARR